MAKDLNNSNEQNSPNINEDDAEKSLVGKFKSIISNTPLSKWFRKNDDNRSTIRRREEENDDEVSQMQPPAKRARLPNIASGSSFSNLLSNISETTVISDTHINKTYNHFPEPVAGPSGLRSQKLLNSVNNPTISARNIFSNDLLNGHKDSDSEESTSGYSSVARIGSKEHVSHSEGSSKQPSPLQTGSPSARSLFQSPVASTNRSLFSERTTSPKLNTSLSSRRPCFNASTFGSPNFIDKTISTEKIINSPFYNGATIYGGASAYGSKLGRSAKDLKTSLKRSVRIKPINRSRDGGNLVLGKTARKILETLEQYSTPVNDAKKIPVASKRFRPDDSLIGRHVGINPYVKHGDTPSNRELQVPTVSDLLKMKQKAKLQSSTEAVRQIAISSKSDLNAVPPQSSSKFNDNNQKTPEKSDKVEKSKEKPQLSTQKDKSQVSPGLPVSPVPKFDLNVPAPATKKPLEKNISFTEKSIISKPQSVPESRNNAKNFQKDVPTVNSHYKFSDPLIIADNLKSIVAMNNFKFSEPLSDWTKTDSNIDLTAPFAKSIKNKNNGQTKIKDVLSNSLPLDKFKPVTGTWECSTCLIRNQPEKSKCVACEAPNSKLKPAQPESKKPLAPFGEKFKKSDSMWECPTCMIRNTNESAKCVACDTANPKSTTLVSSSSTPGFQSKFQPPAKTWECSTCLIRNKEELSKCAACETPRIDKPAATNQLTNSFKIKNDEWECTVCMIRNKSEHAKCQCCEASKPGAISNVVVQDTQSKPVPKFNFGIDQKLAASFSFGIPPTSKVPSAAKPVEPVVAVVSVAEAPKTNNAASTPTFSFGASAKNEKEKPAEAAKPAEKKATLPLVAPSTAIVKPVVSVPQKTEAKSTLFKITTTSTPTPVVVTDPTDSTGTKPASSSFNATVKPSFSFETKVDNKDKAGKTVSSAPKFDFGKPTNSDKEAQKQSVAAPIFSFVDTQKPVVNSSAPAFGQNKMPVLTNSVQGKAAPAFGASGNALNSSVSKPVETKPFSFTKTPDSGEPASKATMFNFGQSAGSAMNVPPPTTQATGFNFGQITKSPVFSFSAPKNEALAGPPGVQFGAPNAGGNKNGIFTFGGPSQNAAPAKAGFNFGAPSAAAPSTGFNFGGGAAAPTAPAAAPTGGFNFTTAAFDATAKPSFNFSDNPVTFSAQPTDGGLAAPRKIKRAVRRMR